MERDLQKNNYKIFLEIVGNDFIKKSNKLGFKRVFNLRAVDEEPLELCFEENGDNFIEFYLSRRIIQDDELIDLLAISFKVWTDGIYKNQIEVCTYTRKEPDSIIMDELHLNNESTEGQIVQFNLLLNSWFHEICIAGYKLVKRAS